MNGKFPLTLTLSHRERGPPGSRCSPGIHSGVTEKGAYHFLRIYYRYDIVPEIYGRAAGPIPAEIGEPEVGRQGLAATEGGQRRFETRRRVEPTAGGRPGGERSAQHRFLCGTGGIVKGETVFSPFTRSPAKDYPFLPNAT